MGYIINCGCRSHAPHSNRFTANGVHLMGHQRVELYLTYSYVRDTRTHTQTGRVLAGEFELNMLRDKCCTHSGHHSKATTDNLFIRIDSVWHPLSALFTRRSWYRWGYWMLDCPDDMDRTLHLWKLDEMAGYIGARMRRNLHLNRFVTVKGARYGHQWSAAALESPQTLCVNTFDKACPLPRPMSRSRMKTTVFLW